VALQNLELFPTNLIPTTRKVDVLDLVAGTALPERSLLLQCRILSAPLFLHFLLVLMHRFGLRRCAGDLSAAQVAQNRQMHLRYRHAACLHPHRHRRRRLYLILTIFLHRRQSLPFRRGRHQLRHRRCRQRI